MRRRRHCKYLLAVLLIFTFIVFLGSDFSSAASDDKSPRVYVVNYPLKYFTERIADGSVRVEFPAPPDVDPAYWLPDLNTIIAYQKADLILLNGAAYAHWISKVSLSRSKMVDTSYKFFGQYIKLEGAVTHKHGPEGEHEHTATAFTTWLNPKLAIKHARAIENALIRLLPSKKETFQKNYTVLEQDLLAIDQSIAQIVPKDQTKLLIVSHPVYDYFTQRYGLNAQSVHWEPEELPDANMWQELELLLTKYPAKWMIWENEPLKETTEKLRTLGVESIVFNPCGNTPNEGDYLSVMQQNVENLKKVFHPNNSINTLGAGRFHSGSFR